jgi:hypothetical protein
MDAHRCRDGRLLYLFAVDHDRAARALLGALDLLAPLEAAGLRDADAYAPHALGGNLRESANLSPRWRQRIRRASTETASSEAGVSSGTSPGFASAIQ